MVWFVARRSQVILVSLCIILPVSMSRSLAGLAKFSGLALIGIFFMITAILVVSPTVPREYKGAVDEPIKFLQFNGIMNAFGVLGFAYTCHHNLILNYAR